MQMDFLIIGCSSSARPPVGLGVDTTQRVPQWWHTQEIRASRSGLHSPPPVPKGCMRRGDQIRHVKLSIARLPLAVPISDAKVVTGRQTPLTEVVFLFAESTTKQGHSGLGFSYSKRAGGSAQYAHAKEVAAGSIGEDPNDIGKLYTKLLWAGASVGRSGVATQALAALDIALYDLKAKRAGLPLAKFLGAYRDSVRTYNTFGGFLNASLEEVKDRATLWLAHGMGGIKIKVGLPDSAEDLRRVAAVRDHIGWDVPLMVDVNQ